MKILVMMVWQLAMVLFPMFRESDYPVENASKKFISVEEACKKGLIQAEWLGQGSHMGECISLELKNRSVDSVYILVESGRKLVSQDTALQDILIIEEERFELAAGERTRLSIFGFCCESSMASPSDSSIFLTGRIADEILVKLANYLDEHQDLPLSEMQDAVWAISNDHPVSGIYDSDSQALKDLKKYVAELKGEDVPWYSSEYKKDEDRLFTNFTTSIQGELEVTIPHNCMVTICIVNSLNQSMEIFEEDVPYLPGTYSYSFKIPVHTWAKGEYYLKFFTDGNLFFQKSFKL
jgi:hypothetical protein